MSRELYNVLVCDRKTGEFIKNNRNKKEWLYPINFIVYRNFDKERVQIRHTFHNEDEEEVINMLINKFHDIEFFSRDEDGYGEKHYYWDGGSVLCDERRIWWSPLKKLIFRYTISDYWYHDYYRVSIEKDGRVYLDDYDNNYLKMYKISETNLKYLKNKLVDYIKLFKAIDVYYCIPKRKIDDIVEIELYDKDKLQIETNDKDNVKEIAKNYDVRDISKEYREVLDLVNGVFRKEKIDIKLVRKMSNSTSNLNKE